MELDVNDLLQRYSNALAQETQKRIIAEARADAAEAKLAEQSADVTAEEG